jgi:hypothetical protein
MRLTIHGTDVEQTEIAFSSGDDGGLIMSGSFSSALF